MKLLEICFLFYCICLSDCRFENIVSKHYDESNKIESTLSDCKETLTTTSCNKSSTYRTIDGTCNNLNYPLSGSAFQPLRRLSKAAYQDPFHTYEPIGYPSSNSPKHLPTPHEVSAALFHILDNDGNDISKVSNLHMTFGQFLDHDMSLSPNAGGCADPCCESGSLDDFKYPCFPIQYSSITSNGCSKFTRTFPVCQNSILSEKREQVNVITAYIDASMVYGSDAEKALKLRANDDTGKMAVSSGDLLPLDPDNTSDACKDRGGCFMAGDVRVNEHIALVALHTIFVREHNIIAEKLKEINSHWKGEQIYQTTRKIIGAILQKISYDEYVPTMVDLKPYKGYKRYKNPQVTNAFSTAAFRYGHSQIKNSWSQLDAGFNQVKDDIPLRATFWNNTMLMQDGLEPTTYGLCGNASQEVDLNFASGVADKLFIPPGHSGSSNLIALNLQRGRDHGLPSYIRYRKFCRLKYKRWSSIKKDMLNDEVLPTLQKTYGKDLKRNHIDLFVGGLAEKHMKGKLVGKTFGCILKNQFQNLRDGDRFFYKKKGVFTDQQREEIEKISMAKILCQTVRGVISMQEYVFQTFDPSTYIRKECDSIKGINLNAWKDENYDSYKEDTTDDDDDDDDDDDVDGDENEDEGTDLNFNNLKEDENQQHYTNDMVKEYLKSKIMQEDTGDENDELDHGEEFGDQNTDNGSDDDDDDDDDENESSFRNFLKQHFEKLYERK